MATKVHRIPRARLLLDALARLEASGARLPTFTVGTVRLAYSATPERLHATANGKRVGVIGRHGILRPQAKATKLEISYVKTLVERPLDVARGAAILSGFDARCPICGRVLDSKDRLQGIGPGCYAKGEFWRLETDESIRVKNRKKSEKGKCQRTSERTSRTTSKTASSRSRST